MDISDIAPDGWQLAAREPERVIFRTVQGNAQATISVLSTGNPASLADFEMSFHAWRQAIRAG